MNFCIDGGLLVDGTYPLPDDPTDHSAPNLPVLGCNRLRCPLCGALVRSARGVGRKKGAPLDEIYASPELAKADGVVRTQDIFRFYVCRCLASLENSWRRLAETDPDVMGDGPQMPWRCSGHPLVELPHDFDGAPVTSEADLVALVRRVATGWRPPQTPEGFRKGSRWLAKLYHQLAGTSYQPAVERQALALLEDGEPGVRAHALHFFILVPTAAARRKAMDILDGDRSRFTGVPDAVTDVMGDRTLEDGLWRVLRDAVGQVERARQLARKEALTPGKGRRAVFDPLAEHDSDWLVEHALDIVRANPTATDALLESGNYRFPENGSYQRLSDKLSAAKA
jgi:hypothetical protein